MSSARLRRRVRVFTGRGLRLLRTHFFSLLSAVVIGVAFFYAMTSSSFTSGTAPAAPPVAAAGTARPMPLIYARPASIIYYIVSSEEQRQAIIGAMQSDQAFRAAVNSSSNPDEVGFFISTNAEDDSNISGLVENMLETARQNGIGLRIIDIRQ